MKAVMKKILLFLIPSFLLFIVSDCKKTESMGSSNDYRDKYLGVWAFKYNWYVQDQILGSTTDSIFYNGVINYGELGNQLLIQYTEDDYLLKNVETDGRILNECGGTSWMNNCSGYFEADDIFSFSYKTQTNTRLTRKIIIGKKLSNNNTLNQSPTVITTFAKSSMTGAVLGGTVNPNFLITNVLFEYGESSFYGDTISASTKTIAGSKNIDLTASPNGLIPGTEYHFRVKAVNSLGTVYGNDMTFTTLNPSDRITDIDSNKYQTVEIGTQMWMRENLKTTKYNDGFSIPEISDSLTWGSIYVGALCWYNNDPATNKDMYGALYNWYAVNTGKLCPAGWHVPDEAELITLFDYLGGGGIAGGKLKETGTVHWLSNFYSTNESGFTALPGGLRTYYGAFMGLGASGYWWAASGNNNAITTVFNLYSFPYVNTMKGLDKRSGSSVRCLKDN
jgi:uncharacterized protein (TIGR02145 family)